MFLQISSVSLVTEDQIPFIILQRKLTLLKDTTLCLVTVPYSRITPVLNGLHFCFGNRDLISPLHSEKEDLRL